MTAQMKLSDYVVAHIAKCGVRHVFLVTGGGAMHLNDSFGKSPDLQYVCVQHEQAAAMAAEGYARITGGLGVINVTSGPGGINALNGVFGAWTDSIPMLVVSGQVKRETCMGNYPNLRLRQLGYQEADIIGMVRGITKYAVLVTNPSTIRYHLERAIHLATTGRPGPVWLDIPVDVQSQMIDPSKFVGYNSAEDDAPTDREELRRHCREIIARLRRSKRPAILAGSGVRRANAQDLFHQLIRKLRLPITTSRTAQDLLASDDPLHCGRPGVDNGDRPGNFTVQNSDFLLVLGCRLNIVQVGYNFKAFARAAYKIQVDIDPGELAKPTVKPDHSVCADVRDFLEEFQRELEATSYDPTPYCSWLHWCRERVAQYPVVLDRHRDQTKPINPYHFIDVLVRSLDDDDVIACGNGSAFVVTSQVAWLKGRQRLFFNSGCASMGHDLPAAIGAAFAREGKRVICLAGDGSLQMNIQELETVAYLNLPIKLFVLNNNGYLSIRSTQQNFFGGRLVGESPASGVGMPDFVRVAEAFGIPARRIELHDFQQDIDAILATPGPMLAEVMLDADQVFEPRVVSKQLPNGRIISPPPEDMFPFLDAEELRRNLLIPPYEQ